MTLKTYKITLTSDKGKCAVTTIAYDMQSAIRAVIGDGSREVIESIQIVKGNNANQM